MSGEEHAKWGLEYNGKIIKEEKIHKPRLQDETLASNEPERIMKKICGGEHKKAIFIF